MKLTNLSAEGTSFHNVTITTTVNALMELLGEPSFTDDWEDSKVTLEWVCETKNGDVVTIYDWKEYRPISGEEMIEFHLGGHNMMSTLEGKEELMDELKFYSVDSDKY